MSLATELLKAGCMKIVNDAQFWTKRLSQLAQYTNKLHEIFNSVTMLESYENAKLLNESFEFQTNSGLAVAIEPIEGNSFRIRLDEHAIAFNLNLIDNHAYLDSIDFGALKNQELPFRVKVREEDSGEKLEFDTQKQTANNQRATLFFDKPAADASLEEKEFAVIHSALSSFDSSNLVLDQGTRTLIKMILDETPALLSETRAGLKRLKTGMAKKGNSLYNQQGQVSQLFQGAINKSNRDNEVQIHISTPTDKTWQLSFDSGDKHLAIYSFRIIGDYLMKLESLALVLPDPEKAEEDTLEIQINFDDIGIEDGLFCYDCSPSRGGASPGTAPMAAFESAVMAPETTLV